MSTEEIQEIEISMEAAKKLVDKSNAVEKLINNKEFKLVFDQGYFHDEAIRLVHLKADENMQSEENQEFISNQMFAIGTVKTYLETVKQMGRSAKKTIMESEEALEELHEEMMEEE